MWSGAGGSPPAVATPTDEMEAEGAIDEGAIEPPEWATELPEWVEMREGGKAGKAEVDAAGRGS